MRLIQFTGDPIHDRLLVISVIQDIFPSLLMIKIKNKIQKYFMDIIDKIILIKRSVIKTILVFIQLLGALKDHIYIGRK